MAGEEALEFLVGERQGKRVGLDHPGVRDALGCDREHPRALVEARELARQMAGEEPRPAGDVERAGRRQALAVSPRAQPIPAPSPAARDPRSGRRRGTSRRTPVPARRSTPSPLLEYVHVLASRGGAELLGGARPDDDRRYRRGPRAARGRARRPCRRRPQPFGLHARRGRRRRRRRAGRGRRRGPRPDRPEASPGRASANRRRRRRPSRADRRR